MPEIEWLRATRCAKEMGDWKVATKSCTNIEIKNKAGMFGVYRGKMKFLPCLFSFFITMNSLPSLMD